MNTLNYLFVILVFTPFIIFSILSFSVLFRRSFSEKFVTTLVQFGVRAQLLLFVCTFLISIKDSVFPLTIGPIALLERGRVQFFWSAYVDAISWIYLGLVSLLSVFVVHFSVRYLHKEIGFRKFFTILMAFIFGLNLLITAGSLDFFFVGWEIIGISSFLLISFYHYRKSALRNGLRVFFLYRFFDLGLLVGVLDSHLIKMGHDFIFSLNHTHLMTYMSEHTFFIFMGLLIFAAIGKSAQFPFSFWLPRAMEGPTPSSAIFYGSLSVHAGIFLILKTAPLWEGVLAIKLLLGVSGLLTFVVATLSGRAQTTIKGQIAYACIAQIGIMFIEAALGWTTLCYLHFLGNSLLRTYQILISPSIVIEYLQGAAPLKRSFFQMVTLSQPFLQRAFDKVCYYSMNEFFLLEFAQNFVRNPLVKFNNFFFSKNKNYFIKLALITLCVGIIFSSKVIADSTSMVTSLQRPLWQELGIYGFAILAVFFSVLSLVEEMSFYKKYGYVFLSLCVFSVAGLFVSFEELGRPIFSMLVIYSLQIFMQVFLLFYMSKRVTLKTLKISYGLEPFFPLVSVLYLLSALVVIGFPVSSLFFLEEVLSGVLFEKSKFVLACQFLVQLCISLSIINTYVKVFYGQNRYLKDPYEGSYFAKNLDITPFAAIFSLFLIVLGFII